MVDRLFSEPSLAQWYDALCEGREDFNFYLPMVMSAQSVLDVGCGTGALLHKARQAGHTGRLCGIDPAQAMLDVARKRSDVEWILGEVTSVPWRQEFELIIMTGHAFQVYVTDDELRASLAAICSALADDGRFIFETRNPSAQEWQRWTADNVIEARDDTGALVRYMNVTERPVDGDIVTFTSIFTGSPWEQPQLSRSTLRFLDVDSLSSFLSGAGLETKEQFGDWDRSPLAETSPEIITIAQRV